MPKTIAKEDAFQHSLPPWRRSLIAGRAQLVVATMESHLSSEYLQFQACILLVDLAKGHSDSIAKAGGIEAIVNTMLRHQEYPGDVVVVALNVLSCLATNERNSANIFEAGGIAAVLTIMSR
jgi:hypothetical protein